MTDDGLKTLAWCIFWGLLMHGCMSANMEISFPSQNQEVQR